MTKEEYRHTIAPALEVSSTAMAAATCEDLEARAHREAKMADQLQKRAWRHELEAELALDELRRRKR